MGAERASAAQWHQHPQATQEPHSKYEYRSVTFVKISTQTNVRIYCYQNPPKNPTASLRTTPKWHERESEAVKFLIPCALGCSLGYRSNAKRFFLRIQNLLLKIQIHRDLWTHVWELSRVDMKTICARFCGKFCQMFAFKCHLQRAKVSFPHRHLPIYTKYWLFCAKTRTNSGEWWSNINKDYWNLQTSPEWCSAQVIENPHQTNR